MKCDPPVPTEAVLRAAPGGDPSSHHGRTACHAAGLPLSAASATPAEMLAVWTALLLYREVPGRTGEVAAWVDALRVRTQAPWAVAAGACRSPDCDGAGGRLVVVLTAGRYLSAGFTPGVYDLKENVWVERVPDGWLESRVFNLPTLYTACLARAHTWTQPSPPPGPTRTPPPSS